MATPGSLRDQNPRRAVSHLAGLLFPALLRTPPPFLVAHSSACRGRRWEEPHQPDPLGVQRRAICTLLKSRPEVRYIWYDYSCMYQGTRTDAQKEEFDRMLAQCNLLFLGCTVFALPDLSYVSRFWCAFGWGRPSNAARIAASAIAARMTLEIK